MGHALRRTMRSRSFTADHVLLTCSKHTSSLAWEGELFQHLLVLSGITTLSTIRNPPIVPNGFI